ncbi:MAG: hypothetical protein U0167_09380 [bacterium]
MIVFDLSASAGPSNPTFVQLDGNEDDKIWTPNLHQPFCGAYVALGDTLLIVGNDLDDTYDNRIAITMGWASLLDAAHAHVVHGRDDSNDFWFSAGPNDPINQPWGQLPEFSGFLSQCNPAPPGGQVYSYARYYPTVVLLPDRRVLLVAGDTWFDCNGDHSNQGNQPPEEFAQQPHWLMYDPTTNSWQLDDQQGGFHNPLPPDQRGMADYPHLKVLPYGLFWSGNDDMNFTHYYSKLWTPLEQWDDPVPPTPVENRKLKNRNRASCVVLTLDATSSDIRVLMVGGGVDSAPSNGSEGAEIITYTRNANGSVSSSGWAISGMQSNQGRRLGNAVLLPTGQVLEVGGEGMPDVPEGQNHTCELYTPDSGVGVWQWAASIDVNHNRGNHSTAALLPDGRVVSTGWEGEGAGQYDDTYQIYYPPYLFTAGGALVTSRPTIVSTSTADTLFYGAAVRDPSSE